MKINHLAIGLLIPLVVSGCNLVRARGGAEDASSTSGANAAAGSLSLCQEGVIEDGEDGDGQISTVEGRDGYWYTDISEKSEVQPPPKGGDYLMKKGGANGSELTAWMTGSVKGADGYVTLGVELKSGGSYDASKFQGVRFFARGKGGIHFSILDINTSKEGGRCKESGDTDECYNGHGVKFELTPEWKEYRFTWSDLKQEADWGHKAKFEPNAIYNLQWQGHQGDVELYLDELAFIGCPAGSKPLEASKPSAPATPAASVAPAASASAGASAAPAPAASGSAAPAGK